jgi:hypothetical protein
MRTICEQYANKTGLHLEAVEALTGLSSSANFSGFSPRGGVWNTAISI